MKPQSQQSQTHRSLSHKRFASDLPGGALPTPITDIANQWDNIGIINSRLTQTQSVRASGMVFKKFQGDKILELKRKTQYKEGSYSQTSLLPVIDFNSQSGGNQHSYSLFNSNNNPSINVAQSANWGKPVVYFSSASNLRPVQNSTNLQSSSTTTNLLTFSPQRRHKPHSSKSEKLKLLILLGSLKKVYEQDSKPTGKLCALVQEVLEVLEKQDNLYGDAMKVFFSVLKDMIFCGEQELIDFVSSFSADSNTITVSSQTHNNNNHNNSRSSSNSNNSQNINNNNIGYFPKPYFSYIETMRNELVARGDKISRHSKDVEDAFAGYKARIAFLESTRASDAARVADQITSIQAGHAEEFAQKNLQIERLEADIIRAAKENAQVRDSCDKQRVKLEETDTRLNSYILLNQEFKEKIANLTAKVMRITEENNVFQSQIEQLTMSSNELKDQLGNMTPRPQDHFTDMLSPLGIDPFQFAMLSLNEKLEMISQKVEQRLDELKRYQSPKHPLKKKTTIMISPNVITEDSSRLNSSPTLKMARASSISPGKKPSGSSPNPNGQMGGSQARIEGVIRRNTKKAYTYVGGGGGGTGNNNSSSAHLNSSEQNNSAAIIKLTEVSHDSVVNQAHEESEKGTTTYLKKSIIGSAAAATAKVTMSSTKLKSVDNFTEKRDPYANSSLADFKQSMLNINLNDSLNTSIHM